MKEENRLPAHVAVIMDGNGRWAEKHNLPRTFGHRKGVGAAEAVVEACAEAGISYLTLFCFSSENWNRPADEVAALMDLLRTYFKEDVRRLQEKKIRVLFSGRLERLPDDIRQKAAEVSAVKIENPRLTVVLALSYGGREEIADAAKKLARAAAAGEISPDAIDEAAFSRALYLPDVPDPDLLIRSGGEKRVSNFLLWQGAYTEIVFSEKLWPDFSKEDLRAALNEYASRNRRFGRV